MIKLVSALSITVIALLARPHDAFYPPIVPDAALTPGVSVARAAASDVCRPDYVKWVGSVSPAVQGDVFHRYGVPVPETLIRSKSKAKAGAEGYQVDHLIPLELGGTNDVKNLWVQSYDTEPWNAHMKDQLELALKTRVCDGTLSLEEAQASLRSNWIAAYSRFVYVEPAPLSRVASGPAPDGAGLVASRAIDAQALVKELGDGE